MESGFNSNLILNFNRLMLKTLDYIVQVAIYEYLYQGSIHVTLFSSR